MLTRRQRIVAPPLRADPKVSFARGNLGGTLREMARGIARSFPPVSEGKVRSFWDGPAPKASLKPGIQVRRSPFFPRESFWNYLPVMLPHTERIDGFARKVTRTEKAFYERFRQTEEAAVVAQMRDHFAQAKQTGGALRLDHPVLHARLEAAVTDWIVQACADQHLNREWIARAEEAILHRVRMLLAQTLRDALGTR